MKIEDPISEILTIIARWELEHDQNWPGTLNVYPKNPVVVG